MHTVDFMNTYSPTPEALCVKTVVVVAVECDWKLRQLDVKQVFIQADLDDDVYMKLEGFNDSGGRGYGDFVPGEVIKTAPSKNRTT